MKKFAVTVIIYSLFFLYNHANAEWAQVNWDALTAGLSELDEKVISDRLYAKTPRDYYRAIRGYDEWSIEYSSNGNDWYQRKSLSDSALVHGIDVIGYDVYLSYSYRNIYSGNVTGYIEKQRPYSSFKSEFTNYMYSIEGVAELNGDIYTVFGGYLKNLTKDVSLKTSLDSYL